MPSVALLASSALLALGGVASAWPGQGKTVVSAWYPSYHADLLPPSKIDWKQYTHMDYFVAESPSAVNSTLFPLRGAEGNMKAVIKGAHDHGVSISISIGGWTGSLHFSYLVGSAANRTAFAENIASFVKHYGFDGVDLDWEYPNNAGIGCNAVSPNDAANFLEFIKALRKKLPKARLSADVAVGGFYGPDGNYLTNLKPFGEALDFINIMAYDLVGPGYFSPTYITGPNAPLYDTCSPSYAKFSVQDAVTTWVNAGVARSKLVLGVPSYGYAYKTLSPRLSTTDYSGKKGQTSLLWQSASSVPQEGGPSDDKPGVKDACGNVSNWGGVWMYGDLVQKGYVTKGQTTAKAYGKNAQGGKGYKRYYDSCSQTPFLFNEKTKSFIAYDDPVSLWHKGRFAHTAKLAGVNVFDATGDTSDSILLKSLREGLFSKP